jgi:hypothetical protein
MNNNVCGILGFLVILTTYIMVLVALAPVLPVVLLTMLLAWLVIRRPMMHPERWDSDVKVFQAKTGAAAGKLVEILVRPLTHRP